MGKRRRTPEQIINKLLQAEVELARGLNVPEVCRRLGVSEQTYYRWRKKYGGLGIDQASRLKQLEKENIRLKRLLAELNVDRSILEEVVLKCFAEARSKGASDTGDGFLPLDPRQRN